MPITRSHRDDNDINAMLRDARHQVRDLGGIMPLTANALERCGFDVGALERRLLDNVEAA